MRVRVQGGLDAETPRRFHEYVRSSPARHEGWVDPESPELYQVSETYLEPFRELAANFGLTVQREES
jgi:hypothetical protein